jgi:hypothetical protein
MFIMKIHLGCNFDSEPYLEVNFPTGEVVLGEAGFVQVLENRLGHHVGVDEPFKRVLQYQHCLDKVQILKERFYTLSFSFEPFAVTEKLLGWRDQLFRMGWDGKEFPTESSRLIDLFEVECEATNAVALNQDQRIQNLMKTLESANPGIGSITIHSPPETFSYSFRLFLEQLGRTVSIHWDIPTSKESSQESDLQVLRDWFMGGERICAPFQGDGSLELLAADTSLELALRIQFEFAFPSSEQFTWIIDSSYTDVLFESGSCLETPLTPLSRRLSRNPVLHWVLLFFHNLWEPFDPGKMMEYLLHPVGGLPIKGRRKIAEFISSQPGFALSEWLDLLGDSSYSDDELGFWLASRCFDPAQGIPGHVFEEVSSRVSAFLHQKSLNPDDPSSVSFQAAKSFLEIVLGELNVSEGEFINRKQWESIAFRVGSRMGSLKVGQHELDCFPYFHSGFAMLEDSDSVTWWPGSFYDGRRSYWTEGELEEFSWHGLCVEELSRESLLPWFEMERILTRCKKKIRILRTNEFAQHPVFSVLNAVFEEPVFTPFKVSSDQQKDLEPKPLPGLHRWWDIPELKEVVSPRETESYSSLNSLVFSPYQWLFRYSCGLQEHLDLPSVSNRLRGQLAHRIFEIHFSDYENRRDWGVEQIQTWFDSFFLEFTQTHAALFFLEENRAQLANFRRVTSNSLIVLQGMLRRIGAKSVSPEKKLALQEATAIQGFLDLLVELDEDKWLVIDLKWSRSSDFVEDIERGRALQLAVYEHLVSGNFSSKEIYCAFFVISDARLILNGKGVEGLLQGVPTEHELSLLYSSLRKDAAIRQFQLQEGRVEVPVSGTEAEAKVLEEEVESQLLLRRKKRVDTYNDYRVLTGWRKAQ